MKKSAVAFVLAATLLTGCMQKEEAPVAAVTPPPTPAPVEEPKDVLAELPANFRVASFSNAPASCTSDSGRHWAMVAVQVEMMVTSLNCGAYYGNPNAYAEYRAMAGKNSDVFAEATRLVASSMGQGREGLRRFDAEQTRTANALALSAGGFNQAAFCEPRRAWFERMTKATRDELKAHGGLLAPAMCQQQQLALAQAEDARKAAEAAKKAGAKAPAARQGKAASAKTTPAKAPAKQQPQPTPAKRQVAANAN